MAIHKYEVLMQMVVRLLSFQTGGTKLKRVFSQKKHTQRKLLNLEN